VPVILAIWETEIGRIGSRPAWANSLRDPISEIIRAKWTGGMAQALEHLLGKHEPMSSNPRKKRKRKGGREGERTILS
jgi:hypothetical protein